MTGSAQILHANSRHLPLADNTVDLVVTSPPYFALRSYQDGGEHYAGQVGDEATPAAFVASLLEVTRECMRVLKPSGSLFVNLGDKYSGSGGDVEKREDDKGRRTGYAGAKRGNYGIRTKSLIGIPWRYALACIDELGLILRAEIVWEKPNGLPESVTDRVRRSHEQWFHFVLNPRYFSTVDEIREPHNDLSWLGRQKQERSNSDRNDGGKMANTANTLGKLPGSVWTIEYGTWTGPIAFCPRCGRDLRAGNGKQAKTETATACSGSPTNRTTDAPTGSPTSYGSDLYLMAPNSTTSAETSPASDPTISNPSPSAKTSTEAKPSQHTTEPKLSATTGTSSHQPTPTSENAAAENAACVCESALLPPGSGSVWRIPTEPLQVPDHLGVDHFAAFPTEWPRRIIQGWSPAGVCVACKEGRRPTTHKKLMEWRPGPKAGGYELLGASRTVVSGTMLAAAETTITDYACACPTPDAPTTPAVILDPFGGTGTTALVAKALGRHGITVDMSGDYSRLATWRCNDPQELAKAARVTRSDAARAADALDMDPLFDWTEPA